MNTSSFLALRGFGGVPEITPDAHELKRVALLYSKRVQKVTSEDEQSSAVAALRELQSIRTGIEATRKSVKAPVLELGKQIDRIASDFIEDIQREELRVQGHVNHFQRKQLEEKRSEEERLQREAIEAQRLESEAKKKREEAERLDDPIILEAAEKLEEKALDAQMAVELSAPLVVSKPKGLVVQSRLNFSITDAIVFCQAYPDFFSWNEQTETLKLRRREILEELNRDGGRFHLAKFPEELPDRDSRIVKPPGMKVFEETKSHVR